MTGATAAAAGAALAARPGPVPAGRPARDGCRGRVPGGRGGLRPHRPARHPAVRVLGDDHPADRRPLPLRRVRPAARRGARLDPPAEPLARSGARRRRRRHPDHGPRLLRAAAGELDRGDAHRRRRVRDRDRDAGRRPNPGAPRRRRPGRRRRREPAHRDATRRHLRDRDAHRRRLARDRHDGAGPRRAQRPRVRAPGDARVDARPTGTRSDRAATAVRARPRSSTARPWRGGDHRRLRVRRRAHLGRTRARRTSGRPRSCRDRWSWPCS